MTNRLTPDLCVIGAGSGGLTIAAGASQMGADVVLIEKGIFTAVDVQAQLDLMETRSDRNGARLVARGLVVRIQLEAHAALAQRPLDNLT